MRETPAEVFHGRVAELDLLAEALRDAVAGGASAVLLGGDAGVGKTRLVSEFGRTATSGGAVVLSGRALDIADAPPFWPVVSALREQSRSRGALGRECAAALSRLDRADAPAGRVEMLGELAAVVERAARRAPVVLVVDDLHRADRSTRDLFAYLLAALSSSPVLLVGTYRDDPAGGVPIDLLGLTGELRRHRGVRFARVEPLPRHELAELVARWAPERHDIEDLVWRHSGGNVFLARETVRAVLEGDPHGVPQTVRELVRAGAAGLSAAVVAANGLFRAGAWDEAEREVATAWAAAPSGAQMLELRLARARLRMGRGDLDGSDVDLTAAELVAGSTGLPKQRLPLLILRAGLEMWRGNPELAFAHVGKGLDVVESGIDDVFAVAPLLWHGARAHAQAVLAGRPPDASGLRRLRRHRRDLVERGERSAPALRGVIASYEAMCSAEDARITPGADPDIWRGVADLLDGLGQPYPGSYARLRSAEALLSGRRTENGAADLRRAAELAAGLRAGPLLTEIGEVAHRARIEVPALGAVGAVGHAPVAVDGPLARLTDREREVLEVLADGATNKQIAARLFITPKTVGAHLASVFAKLDVTNRTSAAAVLREHRADI